MKLGFDSGIDGLEYWYRCYPPLTHVDAGVASSSLNFDAQSSPKLPSERVNNELVAELGPLREVERNTDDDSEGVTNSRRCIDILFAVGVFLSHCIECG